MITEHTVTSIGTVRLFIRLLEDGPRVVGLVALNNALVGPEADGGQDCSRVSDIQDKRKLLNVPSGCRAKQDTDELIADPQRKGRQNRTLLPKELYHGRLQRCHLGFDCTIRELELDRYRAEVRQPAQVLVRLDLMVGLSIGVSGTADRAIRRLATVQAKLFARCDARLHLAREGER